MSCAEFEAGLARMLEAECPEPEHQDRLEALHRHALGCSDCAAAQELLDFLALPAAERDLAEPPGEDYWENFDSRLEQRLSHDDRARPRLWWGVAAAGILVVLSVLWQATFTRSGNQEATWSADKDLTSSAGMDELPSPLVTLLTDAELDEAVLELETAAGLSGHWQLEQADENAVDAGYEELLVNPRSLIPDPAGLEPQASQELLDWLRLENKKMKGVTS